MRVLRFLLVATLLAAPLAAQEATPLPYKEPTLPVAQRVADLLKRMTVEEKVDQIAGGRPLELGVVDPTGNFTDADLPQVMRSMFDPYSRQDARDRAILHNALQRYRLEKTRLGIPSLFFGEGLHGYMAYGATSFPQAIALASTWDPALVERVYTATADEMASSGIGQALTPVLGLARDPRWGRTEETMGEDPWLVSRMAVAAVEGLQGDGFPLDRHHVLATMKHYAVHSQPESGTNTAPGNYSERIIRETFFVPFEAAVKEAHVGSVMASYNEINGIPAHIDHWLLTDVLRKEWGFDGFVVSDGGGLQMLVRTHHVAADFAEAARKAIAAGVDYDLSDGSVYRTLVDQVKAGTVKEADLDRAAGGVLTAKFRLGLFEDPYVDPDYAARITNSTEHQALALEAAQKAIVLLKNDGNLLPLDPKKLKTVAVIGPDAADVHVGGYSRDAGRGVSLLDGIRARLEPAVRVLYAEGCQITPGKQGWEGWYENHTQLVDPRDQETTLRAAENVAREADVAIVVVGETESTNREAWSEEHLGDRDSLDLLGAQDELVRRVVETGTPTVVFLLNGRPLSIVEIKKTVPAILEGWWLGQEGGTAAASVLFGDFDPGGKLPITFPRSVGQIPDFYDHKPSRNRSYIFSSREPLFPFGYGLSYTTFRFDHVRVEPSRIRPGEGTTVRVDVTNTGTRAGDEVAQVYVHDQVASFTRPVMQLAAFERVHLAPGETRTVELRIAPDSLSLVGEGMKRVVEPGDFDVMVGPSSAETTTVTLHVAE